jgi:hypothetical protein
VQVFTKFAENLRCISYWRLAAAVKTPQPTEFRIPMGNCLTGGGPKTGGRWRTSGSWFD